MPLFDVIEHRLLRPQPVLKLREDCPVSDQFRVDMNQWLLDIFGVQDVAYIVNRRAFKSIWDLSGFGHNAVVIYTNKRTTP